MKHIRLKLIALILAVALLLTGCQSHGAHISLDICGSYAVPGMFHSDLKGNESSTKTLETDSQGRTLFSFQAYNVITEQTQTATVICQKSDNSYVYFYENLCYILGDASEEDITALKERNDWGKTLDSGKMTKRPNKATADLHIKTAGTLVFSDIRDACCKELSLTTEEITELCFLDRNPQGQELYWLKANRAGSAEGYCIMVDTQYAISYILVSNPAEDMGWLVSFKQSSGWGQ